MPCDHFDVRVYKIINVGKVIFFVTSYLKNLFLSCTCLLAFVCVSFLLYQIWWFQQSIIWHELSARCSLLKVNIVERRCISGWYPSEHLFAEIIVAVIRLVCARLIVGRGRRIWNARTRDWKMYWTPSGNYLSIWSSASYENIGNKLVCFAKISTVHKNKVS